MNIEGWYPLSAYASLPNEQCSGPGTSTLADQITLQMAFPALTYGTPAWVCTSPGNTSAWNAMDLIEGEVRMFPISDPLFVDGSDLRNWRYVSYFQAATVVQVFDGNDSDGEPTCGPLAARRNNQTCMHLRGRRTCSRASTSSGSSTDCRPARADRTRLRNGSRSSRSPRLRPSTSPGTLVPASTATYAPALPDSARLLDPRRASSLALTMSGSRGSIGSTVLRSR
jgi:hypothetical protein